MIAPLDIQKVIPDKPRQDDRLRDTKNPLLQLRDTYAPADKIAATLRKFFRNSFACVLKMPVIIQYSNVPLTP